MIKEYWHLVLVLSNLLDSAQPSGSSSGDETDLPPRRCFSRNCTRLTDVLVVSSTEGMLNGILCHTSNLGPRIPLDRRRRTVFFSSSLVTTTAKQPLPRANLPRSPAWVSMLHTMVPSGTWFKGRTFPTESAAFFPQ